MTRKEKNSIKLSIMRTGLLLNHAHPSLFAPFLTSRGLPASHLTPGSHSAVFGQMTFLPDMRLLTCFWEPTGRLGVSAGVAGLNGTESESTNEVSAQATDV